MPPSAPPAPAARARAAGSSPRALGQLLVAAGALTDGALADALAEQRGTRERLGQLLVRRGADPEQVARALAAQLRLGFAPAPLRPDADALALVEPALARRHRVVPLGLGEGCLRVAMADPLDASALDDLQFQTGRRVEALVAVPAAVDEALGALYGAATVERILGRMAPPTGEPAAPEGGEDVAALRRASEAPPVVSLVDLVLERALAAGSSDVHVEPAADGLRVRARTDGELRPLVRLPAHLGAAVASRIKVMAGLDIATKRRPQDGRGAVRVHGRVLGLRVSTLPTAGGEKVVLRLLDPDNAGRRLEELGMGAATLGALRRVLLRTHGAMLVTGPTGSGKTTTLYAILAEVDRERRNVVTLEDPIEYRLEGLTQVQVQPQAGLTFAAALRAVLRQDPDVVMVGELRDRETVEAGMAAALTGHLVLSTLHTNDAPSAVARLVEMGVPPYLVAGGIAGVLAQRLVRRLCSACRVPASAQPAELASLGLPAPAAARLFVAGGCERCHGSGYRGRIGIFELLVVDGAVRAGILARSGGDRLREAARAAGMVTLGEDAWLKVSGGLTTLEEVRPHLALLVDEAPACGRCGALVEADFLACAGCGAR
ncbi:MAG TPA: GspE/PulE family protein, partial [Longimicrobiales bacterium]|nr:GspE/PulE family protein [Longimicrobiales bacterium]